MHSCIYVGRVRHTRTKPAFHRFRYRVFMMYLDLEELPELFKDRWFWSSRRPALARFERKRHMGDEAKSLIDVVRSRVAAEIGRAVTGPIRLLTNLSYFGYWFNPVSFYYCFDDAGEALEAIVVEVNNTPWGEQDSYILDCRQQSDKRFKRFAPSKKFHVSPFMPMTLDYNMAMTQPDDSVSVHMGNRINGQQIFHAGLSLERREISTASLAGVLLRYPFQSLRVTFGIHYHALRLWLKRCPIYIHPAKKKADTVPTQ
ncbi:MAG: DUF1365 domain-containing protein [Pseudomonadota bacterium]